MRGMSGQGAVSCRLHRQETEKMEMGKEQNQTESLSAVISSIWLGASSWRANSGLAR